MKRTSIVNYIVMAALVSVIILTIYTLHKESGKQNRLLDDLDPDCMDCFNSYDHFYDDHQLYSF